MNSKSKISDVILYVSLLAFIAFVAYVLHINQELLYTAHDRSEFIYGAPFFHTLLSKPFGLMQYVGAWLTQLFYYPALGAGVLVSIWFLVFLVGAKAFRLRGNASALMLLPIACLLTSIIDLGYWVYIFSIRGYWFSQSLGYLAMLLLLWAARSTPRKWHLVWYLLGFCFYPLLGWFALLFVLCLVLAEKPTWRELIGLVVLVFTAVIWRALLYSNQNPDDVMMAGFPRFVTPVDSSERLSIPFWVLGVVSVLIALYGWFMAKRKETPTKLMWFVPVLSAVAGIVFTCSLMFHNQNYIDEMRMIRHAEADNWQEVLHMAEENKQPTQTMAMLINIALMNEGGLLDRSFKLGTPGEDVYNPDSLHIGLLNIASPLVYYNYGKMNYAIRLCYENAVATGFSPFYMKMVSRCARATGEEKLAERYNTLLHHNMFYGNWQPTPITKTVNELQKSFTDEINGVENNSERFIIYSFSHSTDTVSKVASEQALFYSMIRCDSGRFWASLRKYVKMNPDAKFPLHAQEAYIMYMDKSPEEKQIMLPVEQPVYDRYKKFWETLENLIKSGVKQDEIGARMHGEWGDTYWYYNIFGRKAL
ncbi:MAG: hypothetical protein IKQ77_09665 [Prevotella sp.]|nr:hypothetical protein [Prevotella sp.]